MTIIKRADLGRPLTWDELDDNFQQVDDLSAAASAAVSSASASATAAATSATASATSATDAANSAANAAAAIVSAVKSTITFTTGGTLNSNLDRISDGTYLYYWTGAYPVTIPADSTVEDTGGIGVGFWAPDTGLILQELLSSTSGTTAVVDIDGLTVRQKLDLGKIVYPEMFGVGLTSPTDDDLWGAMFTAIADMSDADDGVDDGVSLSTALPYTIDLRGKTYTLLQSHSLDVNVNIINGTTLIGDGVTILFDDRTAGAKTRRHWFRDWKVRFVGTSYMPGALVEVARSYNTHVLNCDFWPGDSTVVETSGTYTGKFKRARYGLWLGSKRAWGCSVIGGDYYGGDIPCRIGFTNDHTGLTVTGGATFHHGVVGNLLLCNPAGFSVTGCNIEHSEDGAWGLAVVSGANGGSNPARAGLIAGNYLLDNGDGTTGTTYAPAGILVGYDVPGTMDFDNAGSLITSDGQSKAITVQNNVIISTKQTRAVKMKGLAGLKCVNNDYLMKSGETYGFTFEGTCARSDCIDNRNQSTGVFDEVEYTSSTKIRTGTRTGTFLPQLVGSTVAGSLTYSTRGGNYKIIDDYCYLSLWFTVSAVTTQPTGSVSIALPVPIASGQLSGAGVDHVNLAGTTSVTVSSLPVTTTVSTTVNVTGALDSDAGATLTASGTGTGTGSGTASGTIALPNTLFSASARISSGTTLQLRFGGVNMQGTLIQAGTAMELSINYPVAGATYTGA